MPSRVSLSHCQAALLTGFFKLAACCLVRLCSVFFFFFPWTLYEEIQLVGINLADNTWGQVSTVDLTKTFQVMTHPLNVGQASSLLDQRFVGNSFRQHSEATADFVFLPSCLFCSHMGRINRWRWVFFGLLLDRWYSHWFFFCCWRFSQSRVLDSLLKSLTLGPRGPPSCRSCSV